MRFGKTTGAAFLFVDLMRQNGDFLVRRLGFGFRYIRRTGRHIEVTVGFGIHLD